ncbi:LLM class F420-dependent oxidoreductase [Halobacteriales archaeon QH_8_68_33]|nr:MAG: LLM class F420-dependent oxidoreductase [Halobacteriales archaeon QH_8_68_33]
MPELGYALSTEEHPPGDLVEYTSRAEDAGFEHALISDHFHPWVGTQGHAPFVWTVLGAMAHETDEIRVGTGVTCPFQRYHPAVVAQAAATAGVMFDDRFFLGVGTGENLNEHVTGERWPPFEVRIEALAESVDVMDPPPVHVAGGGTGSASAAAEIGDGYVNTAPDEEALDAYDGGGPKYGQVTVCWAESDAEARRTAHEHWPNIGLAGELSALLPTVKHFEQAASMVSAEDVAESMTCSSDPDDHIDAIQKYLDAGFDHVYVHQVGPDQAGFFDVYESEVLPSFR